MTAKSRPVGHTQGDKYYGESECYDIYYKQALAEAMIDGSGVMTFDEWRKQNESAKSRPAGHTPGEWHVKGQNIVAGEIGIAKVYDNIGQPREANARLIAVAPSMHNTLKGIARTSMEYHPEYRSTQSRAKFYEHQLIGVIQSAKIAIRKARGE